MSLDPKPVMAAFIHSLQERIVGKEIAQFQNGFAQLLQGGVSPNKDYIGGLNRENSTFERVYRQPDVVISPVLRPQFREMDMNCPPAFAMPFQPLQVIKQQVGLARLILLTHFSPGLANDGTEANSID